MTRAAQFVVQFNWCSSVRGGRDGGEGGRGEWGRERERERGREGETEREREREERMRIRAAGSPQKWLAPKRVADTQPQLPKWCTSD